MHLVLHEVIHGRDNQMPFRGLLVKRQKLLPLSTNPCHVSNITRRQCWVLHSFRKPHCWFEKMLSKRVDICVNKDFSKNFDNIGRILTGLKFSFIPFLLFLCTGVTSANFKEEGKLEVRKYVNIFRDNSSGNIGCLWSFGFA